MKALFTCIGLFLLANASAQDTLSCKDDLVWNKEKKFYYKKGDAAQTPYTGPAKCFPRKGYVNRGYLSQGSWEGCVYGYKDNKLAGKAWFSNGIANGPTVTYLSDGKMKDSVVYRNGAPLYGMWVRYDKTQTLKRNITEKNYTADTTIVRYFDRIGDFEYTDQVNRFKGKKYHGLQEYFEADFLTETDRVLYEEIREYKDGVLVKKTEFDNGEKYLESEYTDGKLSMEREIDNEGNVYAVYPIVRKKKHGTALIYETPGAEPVREIYEKGKLVRTE